MGVHIDLYAAQLLQEGYSRQSARHNIRVICDFSHWLARQRLGLEDLDEQTVDQYQQFRRDTMPQRVLTYPAALAPVVATLIPSERPLAGHVCALHTTGANRAPAKQRLMQRFGECTAQSMARLLVFLSPITTPPFCTQPEEC